MIENQTALASVKAFIAKNDGAIWVDALIATLSGLSVEGVNEAINNAAEELYGALCETQPKLAFGMATAFVSMVHERLEAKLSAQAAKPEPGRSPWRRWELQ